MFGKSFLLFFKNLLFKTREELREALENEMRAFIQDRDLGQGNVIAWNHIEFEVIYSCLADEIKIGEYFLRILLECGSVSYDNIEIKKPVEFFNDLYHRFLLTSKIVWNYTKSIKTLWIIRRVFVSIISPAGIAVAAIFVFNQIPIGPKLLALGGIAINVFALKREYFRDK